MNIQSLDFPKIETSRHRGRWHSVSSCKRYFLKLQDLNEPQRQRWNLQQTNSIMQDLLSKNCQSVPEIFANGFVDVKETDLGPGSPSRRVFFQITEFVSPIKLPRRGDLVFSLLELYQMGVFPSDIKKNNLGWKNSRLYFLDFDQSVLLDINFSQHDAKSKIHELEKLQQKEMDFSIYSLYGNPWNRRRTEKLFDESGRFVLQSTKRYQAQQSTRNRNGHYHSINSRLIYGEGTRDIDSRVKVLENYPFDTNARILDFGANLGLVGQFLSTKVKQVDAYELDTSTSSLGQSIMNIHNSNVFFLKNSPTEKYKYVVLFSVLQHISKLSETALKLDELSDILFIENRLEEKGKVIHSRNRWSQASSWRFDSIEELHNFLLSLFPMKKRIRTLGSSDKNRYIFEIS